MIMLITDISKYKGNTYKVSFQDYEPVFLHIDIINEYNLKKNMDIPDEAFSKIMYTSDKRRAKERALYLLTVRDHSYKELYDKLCHNYPDEISKEVCYNMTRLGLIDDYKYARKLCEEYIISKKYGEYRVKSELYRRGIDKNTIEELLEEYNEDSEERLEKLVERKYARYLTDRKGLQKVKSALARQGYSFSDINSVLENYSDEIDWDY